MEITIRSKEEEKVIALLDEDILGTEEIIELFKECLKNILKHKRRK